MSTNHSAALFGAPIWPSHGLNVAQLSQHARLVTLELPESAGSLAGDVLVERFVGREGVNELFDFQIDTLATSSAFDPFALIGQELTLRLLLADGSQRAWHGQLARVDALGGDGGLARYRLHLTPWLAQLALRRDSFVYVDKDVQAIAQEIFADHLGASCRFDVSQPLAQRPTCVQYRESDLAFLIRLLAQEGLSWRFEHEQGPGGASPAPSSSSSAPCAWRHRLVIFDAQALLPECPASPLRFHRVDATESEDAITGWSAQRQLTSTQVSRGAWDAATLQAPWGHQASALALGEIPALEDHDGAGAQRFADSAAAAASAEHQLLAHQSRTKRYTAGGSVRQLAPGQRFALRQHSRYGDSGDGQRFVALSVRHEGANNLGAQAAQVLGASELERGSYRNTFEAQSQAAPIVAAWIPAPTAPEGMLARVVGLDPDDAPTAVHTQRDHRVQVRFDWQAQGASSASPSPSSSPSSSSSASALVASGRQASRAASVWLRVATPLAGPNWGGHLLPRVGTQVLIVFVDGDIDRPVVSHQLFDAQDLPPWSAGVDSGANHPGVLSGWHSRGLDGAGFNQWVADDAPGQVRTRLATSQAASQLNLGHLNAQAPQSPTRGAWRGTGAELRSDAWVAVRAGEGLLISTVAQPRAQGTQQDAASAIGQLQAAQDSAQRLSDAAQGAQGLALGANNLLEPLRDDLDPAKNGHWPENVNGQQARAPEGGGRQGAHPVAAFARPLMVLDANTSLNLATPASTALAAGGALHWTSRRQAHLAAGRTVSWAAGASAGLFSHEGGIWAIAQEGPVSLQAHTGALTWLAKAGFTVTSGQDSLEVLAPGSITLTGGQTNITLEGTNITLKMPALLDVKGTSKAFVGPAGDPAQVPVLPVGAIAPGRFDQQFVLRWTNSGKPVKNRRFRIRRADGSMQTGSTDAQGHSPLLDTATRAEQLAVEILPEVLA